MWDVLIVGGGPAGLSAAIYLGRSRRKTLLIHSGHSMAKWETDVQNYLGFPNGIDGNDLLSLGRAQALRFHVEVVEDEVSSLVKIGNETFEAQGRASTYAAKRVLIATGLTHLPPEIPGVKDCLGKSLFFCKDCDAFRVQRQRIVIVGDNNEAADYALAMLLYSANVMVATNGTDPRWDADRDAWLREYHVTIRRERMSAIEHEDGRLRTLSFEQGEAVSVDAAFTTRGDVCHSGLAEGAGATLDSAGEVIIDVNLQTSVAGLYAAGCVTPANCQLIIAAGQGATAAQAINRDLLEESLQRHSLPCCGPTAPPRP